MSNQQGAPPRGAPPQAGAYGPGQTVLGGSGYDAVRPARDAGVPIPPTTVRDGYTDHGGAPVPPPPAYDLSPPYGAPDSPYGGADARFDPAPLAPPIGVPPPPRGRGRARNKGGPSLAVIGVISFVVIGSSVTAVALLTRPSGDEKPAPTVEIPVAPPPADPGVTASPTDQPTAATPPPGPAQRALPRPGQMRPGGRPGRPGNNGPPPNGPNGPYNPRSPPRRPR
jgi:hypothetical protein